MIPTLITVAALTWAVWMREYGSYNRILWIVNMIWYLIALVLILASWLIWSLL